MKKVAIISRSSNQTSAFMVAVDIRKEKGELPYDVKLVLHPNFIEPIEAFQPDFAILGPETIVWQKAIEDYLKSKNIPYIIAKGSHFATRQVEAIFALVK